MLLVEQLEDKISEYYDDEMSENDLFNYEARLAISKEIRDYTYQRCFEYFKISNSIKLTKIRAQDRAKKALNEINERLVGNGNSVLFKRVNKFLSNFLLHIKRNNSK